MEWTAAFTKVNIQEIKTTTHAVVEHLAREARG